MKKIIYCLAILGTTFMGCEPNEDIYNNLDSAFGVSRNHKRIFDKYKF